MTKHYEIVAVDEEGEELVKAFPVHHGRRWCKVAALTALVFLVLGCKLCHHRQSRHQQMAWMEEHHPGHHGFHPDNDKHHPGPHGHGKHHPGPHGPGKSSWDPSTSSSSSSRSPRRSSHFGFHKMGHWMHGSSSSSSRSGEHSLRGSASSKLEPSLEVEPVGEEVWREEEELTVNP